MKLQKYLAIVCGLIAFPVLVMATHISAKGLNGDNTKKYVCSESNPASICSAATTCGSSTSACNVDVKRRGSNSASATPNTPNAKEGASFCVKVGTTVTWQSSSRNTGFVLDFGPSSPFDTPDGAIMGGADRPIAVIAKRPGCYKYSVGACVSGSIYGMCGSANTELVVTH
ncbi:MAG TPA: hypothetical protein VK829_17945 [Terriglobales bacterium]|jgi:hypothetical protein|nr:hypothetical protein [Terriglobales bacterium]